jgi:aspartyl protease family protein
MRFYLVLFMAIGIVGSVLSHGPASRASQQPEESSFAATAVHEERSSGEASADVAGGALQIPRSDDGHFYADVEINGTKVHMLIDTGATGIALSRDDARTAGIATSIGMNDVVGEGADGSVRGEYVTIDKMGLGNATAEAMPAIVLNSGATSLLGQSFLAKFASVEIRGDTMTLR